VIVRVFVALLAAGACGVPRIRQWQDLIFWRPSPAVRYEHIEALFGTPGRNVIDWDLIETHFQRPDADRHLDPGGGPGGPAEILAGYS
jgi:Tn3 transposase DDE domain